MRQLADLPELPGGPFGPPTGLVGGPPDRPADHRPPFPGMNPEEGDDYLQQAVGLLEKLVEEQPNVPGFQHLLARCYCEIRPRRFRGEPRPGDGDLNDRQSKAKLAADAVQKATAIMEQLVAAYPSVADYRYDLSKTYAMLGSPGPFSETADPNSREQSRKNLEKALAISEELVAEHPNIPDYAASQVHIRLGLTDLLWARDPSKAEDSLHKALGLQAALVRRYPQNTSFKVWLAVIHQTQARFWEESDKLEESERLAKTQSELQDSINLLKEAREMDQHAEHIRDVLAVDYLHLADVLRRQGDEQAAEDAVKEAENLRRQRVGR